MALISINLGLFNLLPIPVLDGGHLLFFAIEGVLRRPLPLRVREVAHIVGMAILICADGAGVQERPREALGRIAARLQGMRLR